MHDGSELVDEEKHHSLPSLNVRKVAGSPNGSFNGSVGRMTAAEGGQQGGGGAHSRNDSRNVDAEMKIMPMPRESDEYV